jgi:hypothetical protein
MRRKQARLSGREQRIVDTVKVRPVESGKERERCLRLLEKHHYIGALQPVGEQMFYVAYGPRNVWRAVLVFSAAAKHLAPRDQWIGWNPEQRRRRLALVVNNARFLVLPRSHVPNLATRVLRLTLDRLSDDWDKRYGHPLAVVETFVDPQLFQGTVYLAGGWEELGPTKGFARVGRDYYVAHNRPKRLFVRELSSNARRGLQTEVIKPAWASVEQRVPPRCTLRRTELASLVEHLKSVEDFRSRIGVYPLWSLLGIVALAYLCGGPRGQKDLAGFAKRLNQGQRHALGIRVDSKGRYPSPSQPTFSRMLQKVPAEQVQATILRFQEQVRGPAPREDGAAIDGKAVKRSGGEMILSAVTVPSLHYLGSAPVPTEKTNEIPVARDLIAKMDLQDRLVGLDALHTQMQTACQIVQEAGADYMFTVKKNQKGIHRTVKGLLAGTPAAFSPSAPDSDHGLERRDQSREARTPTVEQSVGNA